MEPTASISKSHQITPHMLNFNEINIPKHKENDISSSLLDRNNVKYISKSASTGDFENRLICSVDYQQKFAVLIKKYQTNFKILSKFDDQIQTMRKNITLK